MITLKSTRYFTNGDVEVSHALTFDVLNNDVDKAAQAIRNHLAYEVELPPLEGEHPWREMTDAEAADYQKRQEEEEKEARLSRVLAEDEDDF
jgi:hypothetical protein